MYFADHLARNLYRRSVRALRGKDRAVETNLREHHERDAIREILYRVHSGFRGEQAREKADGETERGSLVGRTCVRFSQG